jgi:cytoskeletal protein CcmA (bactofilin family)
MQYMNRLTKHNAKRPITSLTPQIRDQAENQSRPESITLLGAGITITGEIYAEEHLIINGHVEGTVNLPEHGVAVGIDGQVHGKIFAQTIKVLGRVSGQITAEVLAELRDSAYMEGRLVAPRVAIDEGAYLKAAIDTTRAYIASQVARFRAGAKSGSKNDTP